MNGSFQSTDIYLTSPESNFCPLFFFLRKKNFGDLEKLLLSRNKAKFELFAINTTFRKQKVKKILVL